MKETPTEFGKRGPPGSDASPAISTSSSQTAQSPPRSDLGSPTDIRVRLVRTPEQLAHVVRLRISAYGRHLPDLIGVISRPEPADWDRDSIILLADSRATGEPLGTVRIQTNLHEMSEFEQALELPEQYKRSTIAHISRLAVAPGKHSGEVKVALFKALYRFCLAAQIRWLFVGARPPLQRQYLALGFHYVFGDERLVEIPSSGTVPVRVMAFDVIRAEEQWRSMNHRYYDYIFLKYTPDLEIFSSVAAMWVTPRSAFRGATAGMPVAPVVE